MFGLETRWFRSTNCANRLLPKIHSNQAKEDTIPMNQLDLPVMFDMKTVAKILSVSRSTVYELLRTEQLDAVRIGRARRVSQNQLNSFINRLEGM